jgi:hypothetical protein
VNRDVRGDGCLHDLRFRSRREGRSNLRRRDGEGAFDPARALSGVRRIRNGDCIYWLKPNLIVCLRGNCREAMPCANGDDAEEQRTCYRGEPRGCKSRPVQYGPAFWRRPDGSRLACVSRGQQYMPFIFLNWFLSWRPLSCILRGVRSRQSSRNKVLNHPDHERWIDRIQPDGRMIPKEPIYQTALTRVQQ